MMNDGIIVNCHPHLHFRAVVLVALVFFMMAGSGVADEWLVYIGGGLEAVEGGWEERDGRVLFTMRGGTLVSVPFQDVDLPTSAFITWQLGGRRKAPPRAAVPQADPEAGADPAPDCIGARVIAVNSSETLEVAVGEERETIHLACLDAPETQHQFAELAWFGRATLSAVQMAVKPGAEVCLTELTPPVRDKADHRIVWVSLADGRDYTEAVIFDGLGLLRPGLCDRGAHLRRLEDRAIAEQRGLWGPMSQKAAFQAAMSGPAVSAGPAPARRSRSGST
jgi:endonuclease YncB( thermonuclease family)